MVKNPKLSDVTDRTKRSKAKREAGEDKTKGSVWDVADGEEKRKSRRRKMRRGGKSNDRKRRG